MTTAHLTRTAATALILVAALGLSGCSAISSLITGEGNVFSLEVGDCVSDVADEVEISDVPVVDCDGLHDSEVFAVEKLTMDDFPGLTEVQEESDAVCFDEFEKFIGVSYNDSTLYYTTISPSEETWAMGDREITCVVTKYDDAGVEIVQVTGSLEGSML